MTTRKSRQSTYADLARTAAVLHRELPATAWSRLNEVVAAMDAVTMDLAFSLDDRQRVLLHGRASTTVQLDCQLCAEPVALELRAELHGILARTEALARAWQAEDETLNIVVVASAQLQETELMEDELLLQLPSQVCTDTACPQRPQLSYGPDVGQEHRAEPGSADTYRPFAALADLQVSDKNLDK